MLAASPTTTRSSRPSACSCASSGAVDKGEHLPRHHLISVSRNDVQAFDFFMKCDVSWKRKNPPSHVDSEASFGVPRAGFEPGTGGWKTSSRTRLYPPSLDFTWVRRPVLSHSVPPRPP